MPAPFVRLALDDLRITDLDDHRRAGIDATFALIEVLRRDRATFLVPRRETGWDRVAFLNLVSYSPGTAELLRSRDVPADELVHVALHHLARKDIGIGSAHALLFGEAIASAFDAYLIGVLLRRRPRAAYLAQQVPRLSERALDAGLSRRAFAALLARMAGDPERAFEELRRLLLDVSLALVPSRSLPESARILARFEPHPYAPILHHYELADWILAARASSRRGPSAAATRIDRALRGSRAPFTTALALLGAATRGTGSDRAGTIRTPPGRSASTRRRA
jgi:hypothetical protein